MTELNNHIDKLFPIHCPVVFLHAHPDDESFLTAGLIQELLAKGKRCCMVYMAAALVTNEKKTVIRQEEAQEACALLGIDNILYSNFCEPKYFRDDARPLLNQKIDTVVDNLVELLNRSNISNSVMISYDENGG